MMRLVPHALRGLGDRAFGSEALPPEGSGDGASDELLGDDLKD